MSYFFTTHFDIILPSTAGYRKSPLHWRFLTKILYAFLMSSYCAPYSVYVVSLDVVTLITFSEEYSSGSEQERRYPKWVREFFFYTLLNAVL
jgi:hypothetical protein